MCAKVFIAAVSLAALAASAPSAQSVRIVSSSGAPDAQFADIQSAVDAASEGDMILVRAGTYYGGFEIDGKSLVVAAEPGAHSVGSNGAGKSTVDVGPIRVRGLVAGQRVVLRALELLLVPGDALELTDNQGAVWIEQVGVFAYPCAPFCGSFGATSARIEDCDSVTLVDPRIFGGCVDASFAAPHDALSVVDSTVAVYGGLIRGPGATSSETGLVAGAALRVSGQSHVTAARATFLGGDGVDMNCNGLPSGCMSVLATGGAGIVVDDAASRADLVGTFVSGGSGGEFLDPLGLGTCPPPEPDGVAVDAVPGAIVQQTAGGLHAFATSGSPVPRGSTADAVFSGPPGDLAVLVVSAGQGQIPLPGLGGVALFGSPFFSKLVGVLPASGVLTRSITPSTPLGDDYTSVFLQGLFATAAGQVVLADGSAMTVTDIAKACFVPSQSGIALGDSAKFDGTASSAPGDTVVAWDWDFGDGMTASGPVLQHTYGNTGIYLVELTTTYASGAQAVCTNTRRVSMPPVCSLASPSSFAVGELATFVANAFDPDGTVVKYDWDLGDGTVIETTSATVSHVYAAKGKYGVILTATDDAGVQSVCGTTSVIDGCTFSVSTTVTSAGSPVTFDGVAAPGTYYWSFGDNTFEIGSNPVTHTFTTPGTYKVQLTIQDGFQVPLACDQFIIVL